MTNPVAEKKQLPAFLILTIIALVAALALALTNAITEGPIREHEMAAQREAFGVVLQAEEYVTLELPEGSPVTTLVEARNGGETAGYCVVASAGGYAGPVAVTLGVDTNGVITGAKIGDTNFVETSGFGTRWLADNKAEEFKGIDVAQGGAIEALSGATLTSNAVLTAANNALAAVNAQLGNGRTEPVLVFGVAEKAPVEQMQLTGDIHEGSYKGFASDVKVQLTLDANGVITGLAIESSGETAGFGTRCMEDPAFAEQFVGKTAPVALGEGIEALSGATVTSTAVVEAVNAAAAAPANPDAVPFGSGAAEEEEETVEASAEPVEGALTGTAKGCIGDVTVQVTLDETGAVATLTVDASNETPGLGDKCAAEDFTSQFVGKTAPFVLGENIDGVAGATLTSKAVVEAVNSVVPAAPAAEETTPAAGALTGTAKGCIGDVTVQVTLDETGAVASLTVDASNETPGLGDKCAAGDFTSQFVGKTAPFVLGENIDGVAGATLTSKAVVEAVNSVVPAAPVEETTPAADALTGTAKGCIGDVTVQVTLDETGAVATLTVDASKETPGLGDKCAAEDFTSQFVGKNAPFVLGENIDGVAGATLTSKAVVEAVNSVVPAAPVEETAPAADALTGTAKGCIGEVTVQVTLDETGAVASLTVDASKETPGLGDKCAAEDFTSQFVGKTAPFVLGENIDGVAGATLTSKAVVEAVNSVVPAAPAAEETAPAAEEAPADLTATVPGYAGQDVVVTLTLTAEGAVETLVVDASTQSPGLGKKCAEEAFTSQFVGQTGPFVLHENIDAVSYATVTSGAVVEAVNSLMAD